MIEPRELTVIFGIKGCGKSTLSHKIYSRYDNVIIFDRAKTLNDPDITHDVIGFSNFSRCFADIHSHDYYRIRVGFDWGLNDENFQHDFGEILRSIFLIGKRKMEQGEPSDVCIVFEELQYFCTPYFINPWFKDTILVGRHAGLTVIGNSQRPANIHGDFKSQSANLFCGYLYHKQDIQYLRDSSLGDEAFLIPNLPKYSFLFKRLGEPSQIVTL